MRLPFFRRRPPAVPDAPPPPRGLLRFFRRQPAETPPTALDTSPAVLEEPQTPAAPPPSRLLAPLLAIVRGIQWLLAAFDAVVVCLALPFGVRIRDPRRRYAVLLGLFAVIYFIGALPVSVLPLMALGFGYLGVLAIGRAWVLNEKKRTAIVKKLDDTNPDELPDLRWTALVSALQLLILFPLLFMQLESHFHLWVMTEQAHFGDWLWFTIDKTYMKALPDWSILYGIHISSIDFDGVWGRHLVLVARLTVDYILIQGVLRLLAIRATIGEAVAAVKADPEMAVRLGRRAIPALVEKLSDPDKGVRGAAANALTQLGDDRAIRQFLPSTTDSTTAPPVP